MTGASPKAERGGREGLRGPPRSAEPAATNREAARLVWEPDLLSRVVADELGRLAAAGRPRLAARYRAAAEPLYAGDPDRRAGAFHRLDLATAERLEIDGTLRVEIAAAGWRTGRPAEVLLAPASREADEGADVTRTADGAGRVEIRLRPSRFADRGGLALFLRHELEHACDLLDPGFGYAGDRTVAGAASENLVRDRYRALWCAAIDLRLHRAGRIPASSAAQRLDAAVTLLALPADRAEELRRTLEGARPGHGFLLARALSPHEPDPRRAAHAARGRCPLCEMPAHGGCRPAGDLPAAVLGAIRAESPDWRPGDGLCDRCREVYLVLGGLQ